MKVLVFGTFDHLHPGHRFLLEAASKRGELHVVVARDETVKRIKGKLPDQKEDERVTAIQEAFPNTDVILGDTKEYLVPVQAINPDLIILGYDQKLPPGVSEVDFHCTVERLEAFEPEKYKSSLRGSM